MECELVWSLCGYVVCVDMESVDMVVSINMVESMESLNIDCV